MVGCRQGNPVCLSGVLQVSYRQPPANRWPTGVVLSQLYQYFFNLNMLIPELVISQLKQATSAIGQAQFLFLYHIFRSFYKPFIASLIVAAELNIPIAI